MPSCCHVFLNTSKTLRYTLGAEGSARWSSPWSCRRVFIVSGMLAVAVSGRRGGSVLTDCDCATSCEAPAEEALEEGEGPLWLWLCHRGGGSSGGSCSSSRVTTYGVDVTEFCVT